MSKRDEMAFQRRRYYNHAQYSLDIDDGIENHIIRKEPSTEETYEREAAEKRFYPLLLLCRKNRLGVFLLIISWRSVIQPLRKQKVCRKR